MHYSFLDFLCSALVPVVFAKVAAGTAYNVHTGFVPVAAVWTVPFKVVVAEDFALVAALHTEVQLCVHLGVLHVFVHILDKGKDNLRILCKVWQLYIADCTA